MSTTIDHQLLCLEVAQNEDGECFTRAYADPVLYDDNRVLQNLLNSEDRCLISSSYFKCVQTDVKPRMRGMVAAWMLEVCEDQHCQEGVFSLAMNYLDRFLSVVNISRTQLQLLGAVCLFLASKMKDNKPISGEKLCLYSANSITIQELTNWELLVISKLKWDLWAITPHDFIDYILRRLNNPLVSGNHMIKRHAQTFMTLCATDFNFSMHSPSIIAAASIGTAVRGLAETTDQWASLNTLLARLHDITNIETDVLRSCLEQIEEMVMSKMASYNGVQANANSSISAKSSGTASTKNSTAADKIASRETPDSDYSQAETPTDVRDVVPLLDYY